MIRGVIAGSFDVLHPGYVKMFKESKEHCDLLTVALHADPTIERPEKIKPVLSLDERREMLMLLRPVDEIVAYHTESELESLLKSGNYDVRILGSDYIGRTATGQAYSKKVVYLSRDHGWSTTIYKEKIARSYDAR